MSANSPIGPSLFYQVIKEYVLKEIVQTAGEETITLEFVEFMPRALARLEDEVTQNMQSEVSYFPAGTVFPDKEDKFICLVRGRKDDTPRALINQKGHTRFFSPNAAISLMRELKQVEARFVLMKEVHMSSLSK